MSSENILVSEERSCSKRSLRQKVSFYLEDTETNLGLWLNLIILGSILLSSAIFVTQTYSINLALQKILGVIDLVILIAFTLEYILRFWSAENPQKFFFSFFGLIDLIAILPLLLGWIDIRFLRIFRWFRILRIVRFWKVEKRLLGITNEDSIVFVRIFLTLFTLIFVYAGLIYPVEHKSYSSDRY